MRTKLIMIDDPWAFHNTYHVAGSTGTLRVMADDLFQVDKYHLPQGVSSLLSWSASAYGNDNGVSHKIVTRVCWLKHLGGMKQH